MNENQNCGCPDESCELPSNSPKLKPAVGDLVVIKRNGKFRIGKVVSSGPKYIGVKVLGMKSKTRVFTSSFESINNFFVTEEVIKELNKED